MERSRYFGYSKDLYHFDHFMGMHLATIIRFSTIKATMYQMCFMVFPITGGVLKPSKSAIFTNPKHSFLRAGQFQNEFSDLQNISSYEIQSVEEGSDGTHTVIVETECAGKSIGLKFILARKDIGRKKGALMTRQLLKI